MFISDFAIKRPIVTTVVMLALVVFGIFALTLLNTDEFPDVQNPVVVVSVPYPGASPESVEREVIDRIEEGIAGISGVDKIQSNSLDGYGVIITFFQFEKDLQEATQEIRDKISEIRNELPPEMEEPILTRFNPADLPIMSLVLSSTKMTGPELTRLADPDITRRLRGIPGVAEVEVVGGIERELTVELRPRDLQSAGLSVSQVVQALQSQNLAAPVGPPQRSVRRAHDPPAGPAREAGGLRPAADRAVAGPRDPPRRRRRRARRHRGAALRRRVQRRGGGRPRRQEGEGLQHHAGRRGDSRASRRMQATLPAGRDLPRRPRRRHARRGVGERTSRRRWSKARR